MSITLTWPYSTGRLDENGHEVVGDGPCDAVRKLKNFLTTSLEPGMETFVVMGAISHCEAGPGRSSLPRHSRHLEPWRAELS